MRDRCLFARYVQLKGRRDSKSVDGFAGALLVSRKANNFFA